MIDASQEIDEKKRAFYTILAAAVLIDGKIRPLERVELEALMLRTRTLCRLQEVAREELRKEITRKLRKSFESTATRWDRIDEACEALVDLDKTEPGICQSVFLHALDLAHTDDHLTIENRAANGLHEAEVNYLMHIAGQLGVTWEPDNKDDLCMAMKNTL